MKYHLHSSRKNIFREQEKKRKIRVMYQLPVAFLSFVPISLFIFLSLLLPITSFEIVFFFIKKKEKKKSFSNGTENDRLYFSGSAL